MHSFKSLIPFLLLLLTPSLASAGTFNDDFNNGFLDYPWTTVQNGCSITESAGLIHITGTTTQSTWAGNGIHTGFVFPAGNFSASVDFKVPTFSGTGGAPLTYIQVGSQFGNMVGIFYDYPYGLGYRVQSWSTPQLFSAWKPAFGNETTTYHRLRLDFDSATQVATGYVDNQLIGTVSLGGQVMAGNLEYWLEGVTDRSGMNTDLYYDNFSATPGILPEPASLTLLGLGSLALLRRRARRETGLSPGSASIG